VLLILSCRSGCQAAGAAGAAGDLVAGAALRAARRPPGCPDEDQANQDGGQASEGCLRARAADLITRPPVQLILSCRSDHRATRSLPIWPPGCQTAAGPPDGRRAGKNVIKRHYQKRSFLTSICFYVKIIQKMP